MKNKTKIGAFIFDKNGNLLNEKPIEVIRNPKNKKKK